MVIIFYIVTPSCMFQLSLFVPSSGSNKEPKHVAGSNNVKYTINRNNNH